MIELRNHTNFCPYYWILWTRDYKKTEKIKKHNLKTQTSKKFPPFVPSEVKIKNMKAHLSILPHTMNRIAAIPTFVIASLVVPANLNTAQGNEGFMINNLKSTIFENLNKPGNPSSDFNFFRDKDSAGAEAMRALSAGETGTPPPPEAKNTAGGDPDITAFMNGVTARGISKIPLEELKKILLDANNERLVKLKKDPKPDLDQLIKLKRFITNIDQRIKAKEAEQELADLKAQNNALTTENTDLTKIEITKTAKKEDLAKANAIGIIKQEALDKKKSIGIAEQEALDDELAKEQAKLKIVKTNSNPQ